MFDKRPNVNNYLIMIIFAVIIVFGFVLGHVFLDAFTDNFVDFCHSKGYEFNFKSELPGSGDIYCKEIITYCQNGKCITEREISHSFSDFEYRKWKTFEQDDPK